MTGTSPAQQKHTADKDATGHKVASLKEVRKTTEADPMAAMAWFAGRWRADIKAMNGNPPIQVDTEMKWSENRRALTFQVWFTQLGPKPKTEAEYYGMYFWDPQKKAVRMYQLNSKGDLSVGEMKADGNTFTQETHVERVNGTTQEQHSVINRADDHNTFHWKVQIQKDGKWVDAVELDYRRVTGQKKTTGGMQ